MTLPPKAITVKCPQCEQIYIDWHVPALSQQAPAAQQPHTTCSQCGHRSILSELVERAGTFVSAFAELSGSSDRNKVAKPGSKQEHL